MMALFKLPKGGIPLVHPEKMTARRHLRRLDLGSERQELYFAPKNAPSSDARSP